MKNIAFLQFTSLLFIIPIIFISNSHNPSTYEIVLGLLLSTCVVLSLLFWNNPIQNSYIHVFDSVLAKITIALFIAYTFFLRSRKTIESESEIFRLYLYIGLICIITGCAIMSEHHSSKQWCSNKHVFYHGLLHYFCMIGAFSAFL